MEEQWKVFLRDNAPEFLYEQMKSSMKWAFEWRDQEIKRLQSRLDVFMNQQYTERRFQRDYEKRFEGVSTKEAQQLISDNAKDAGAAARIMDLFNKYNNAASKTIKDADNLLIKVIIDSNDIQQECGKALGYPWYKDDQKNFPDATEADGVCTGEHVAASIVGELANNYISLVTFLQAFKDNEDKTDEMQRAHKNKEHVLRRLDLLGRMYKAAGIKS